MTICGADGYCSDADLTQNPKDNKIQIRIINDDSIVFNIYLITEHNNSCLKPKKKQKQNSQ